MLLIGEVCRNWKPYEGRAKWASGEMLWAIAGGQKPWLPGPGPGDGVEAGLSQSWCGRFI